MSSKSSAVVRWCCVAATLAEMWASVSCGGAGNASVAAPAPAGGTPVPAVSLTPTSLTFASPVGLASAPQSVVLTNSGNASLSITSIAVSPTNFSTSNTCGTGIAAGANCTVSVSFLPTATGAVGGALTITDNAGSSPQTVALSGTGTAEPAVSLSATSLTFASGVGLASAPQSVVLANSGTAALSITSIGASPNSFSTANTCGAGLAAGANCTISVVFVPAATGAVTGMLTITDNAGGSPQTVTLSGTGTNAALSTNTLNFSGVSPPNTSVAKPVTITNTGSSAVSISAPAITGNFAISSNSCGSSIAAASSCVVAVTFIPQGTGPWTGLLTLTVGGVNEEVDLTGTNAVTNQVQVSVNFGPNGNLGSPNGTSISHYNGIYTTVTVCEPGTATCQAIPNILVDTQSVGLRVLESQLTGVSLNSVADSSGNILNECYEYGSTDYTWGPVQMATVQVGGETAAQVPSATGLATNTGIPIQVISSSNPPAQIDVGEVPQETPCLAGSGANLNTVALLAANGILGIGNFPQDCISDGANQCTSAAGDYLYFFCSSSSCSTENVAVESQLWNPVAAFTSGDTNGISLQLPSIPDAGQATVQGTLTFGIGTQSNNEVPSGANVYELDQYGYFGSLIFNGATYSSLNSYGSFVDSASNALYVADAATLTAGLESSVSDCMVNDADINLYCPSSTVSVPVQLEGFNSNKPISVSLPLANALNLFGANPSFAAFDNLGGESGGSGPATDFWDLGLPFFFGKTIFVGLAGTNIAGAASVNGYVAF